MIYLTLNVTSLDLGLRLNFDIDPLMSTLIYFDTSQREEHDSVQVVSVAFSFQKLFSYDVVSLPFEGHP